jgi:hypothetical protein
MAAKKPRASAPKERRGNLVAFRLTDAEKAPFDEMMKEAELNQTDFFRQLVLNKSPVIYKSEVDVARLLFYFSKSSNNLNQLAHSVNLSWKKGIITERLYRRFLNDLINIRELMMIGIQHADKSEGV